MGFSKNRWQIRIVGSLVLGFVALGGLGPVAPAGATAMDTVTQAEDHFLLWEYQQALDLLDTLGDDESLPESLRFRIEILRARCRLGMDLNALARESFCEAHRIDPEWTPASSGLGFTAREIAEFGTAVTDCGESGRRFLPWILGGAGAALLGIVIFGRRSTQTGLEELPGFPDMP